MENLATKIQFVPGVGPKVAQKLIKLGILTVGDLLVHFPRRYDNFFDITQIADLKKGSIATIEAEITEIFSQRTSRKKMFVTSVMLEDSSGDISALWFNQPYLKNVLKIGQKLLFRGKVEYNFQKGQPYLASPKMEITKGLYPIYPETAGLTSRYLRKIASEVFKSNPEFTDNLPTEVKNRQHLLSYDEAVRQIHQPKTLAEIESARERLAFEEIFNLVLRVLSLRQKFQTQSAPQISADIEFIKDIVASLPFKLTDDQRKSAWEIIKDLGKAKPANRLLEGDVGSGKTIVAALAAASVIHAGYQVCWMAPTGILANQHFATISELFKNTDFSIGLLTSGKKDFQSRKTNIKVPKSMDSSFLAQNADFLIGTHALLHLKSTFPRLALVIVDEQHRFGVNQRQKLTASSDLICHFLSLSATPIPRTLALSLYGDLDISIIAEMPKNRQKIETKIINKSQRAKTYQFIASQISAGRQAFVICPVITATEKDPDETLFKIVDEKKAVMAEYKKISEEIFPNFRVGLLHGKMKDAEKDQVMTEFSQGKIDILVSTAVVEVGIDVPNATVMMIEGAEFFGLAQLHQLRGRVGRGNHQSYCFLAPQNQSAESNRRLEALQSIADGFKLAELDLTLRGPGEFWGVRQSGLPDLKIASLSDRILVSRARKEVEKILPNLDQYPELQKEIEKYINEHHLE